MSLPGRHQAVPYPRWKIPPSACATVLQRVEQGEPLHHIARDYGVSYETVRGVLRAPRHCYLGRIGQGSPRSQASKQRLLGQATDKVGPACAPDAHSTSAM
jgi:hypothetical protein